VREILALAWKRFGLVAAIIGEGQGRVILSAFYFTILVPFALISRAVTDPLHVKDAPSWINREPIPTDIESAQQQG
jgi:hypothetical protein